MDAEKENKTLKRQLATVEKEIDKLKGSKLSEAVKSDDSLDGYSGKWKDQRTGDIFALKVVDASEVRFARTHLARSADGKFGDYTEADFFRIFRTV